ncbi:MULTISPECIES: hypothetical protein [unclassified Nocardiopsis]|uniref:hypothetical protein n=1 Tax=unclassified Nocardiopsis TaxID=2649073 RepID=UPI001358D88E|nr:MULTISPECIES: hypothetical protein [unclassified Nocardiopsis]
MSPRRHGPEDIGTGERMATLGAAKSDALRHRLRGERGSEAGRDLTTDLREVRSLVADWPAGPKKVAGQMLDQYGAPNEATPTRLLWYRNGPWRRTLLTRDEIVHHFPTAHTDFLTQYVDYRVPVERFSDLARFDGSCLADRTAGEAAARCDSEAMNILTLNLMHDIVRGARSVEEARSVYAENAAAHTMGRSAPYTERLLFTPPEEETGDPDESGIAGAMAHQAAGKAKDMVRGDDDRA